MSPEERTELMNKLELLNDLDGQKIVRPEVIIKSQEIIVARLLDGCALGKVPSGTPEEHGVRMNFMSRSTVRFAVGASLLLVALVAWMWPRPIGDSEGASASTYVRNDRLKTVIVFVHGINGNPKSTWTCQDHQSWPRMLIEDKAFSGADIYTLSYSSSSLMSIDDVVGNVHNRFIHDRVFSEHRDVVVVAHSLGGLIFERLLLHYREFASHVRAIYFFGTPQTGAQIAAIANAFGPSSLMKSMFPGEQNLELANLRDEWRNAKFDIKRYCAVERGTVGGIVVVPGLSGEWACDQVLAIPKNHIELVKPCSREDDSYVALQNMLTELHFDPSPAGASSPAKD